METRKVASDYRLSKWASIVKERNKSGLRISEFCKKNDISENRFFYWQRKLRETAYEAMTKSANSGGGLAPSGFTEVRLAEPAALLQAPQPIPQCQVSIEARGVRISASCGYPVDKLAKLLREAARPC